jgi:hypothetical protein
VLSRNKRPNTRATETVFCRNVTMDGDDNWLDIAPLQQPQSGLLPDLVERLAVERPIRTPVVVARREVYETPYSEGFLVPCPVASNHGVAT